MMMMLQARSVVRTRRCLFVRRSMVTTTTAEPSFEGVSEEVSNHIYKHAHHPQTAVSLKTLLQTGRGEFLHKTYKDLEKDNDRGATDMVLMQVRTMLL